MVSSIFVTFKEEEIMTAFEKAARTAAGLGVLFAGVVVGGVGLLVEAVSIIPTPNTPAWVSWQILRLLPIVDPPPKPAAKPRLLLYVLLMPEAVQTRRKSGGNKRKRT